MDKKQGNMHEYKDNQTIKFRRNQTLNIVVYHYLKNCLKISKLSKLERKDFYFQQQRCLHHFINEVFQQLP